MRAARPFDDFITLRSIRTPELTFRSAKKLVHDSRSSLRELATSPHELMTRPAMVVNMKYNIDGDRQGTSKSTFPDGFWELVFLFGYTAVCGWLKYSASIAHNKSCSSYPLGHKTPRRAPARGHSESQMMHVSSSPGRTGTCS